VGLNFHLVIIPRDTGMVLAMKGKGISFIRRNDKILHSPFSGRGPRGADGC